MYRKAHELAKGPAEIYPHTMVMGRLDYDYETGNWLTDGIHFKYNMDGKDVEDVVTGTIKWIEDNDRQTNGKGHYEFNLRFNEDKNKTAKSESDAFDKMKEEDAFFAVDNTVPSLTGKVEYVDTFSGGTTTQSGLRSRAMAFTGIARPWPDRTFRRTPTTVRSKWGVPFISLAARRLAVAKTSSVTASPESNRPSRARTAIRMA